MDDVPLKRFVKEALEFSYDRSLALCIEDVNTDAEREA